MGDARLLSISWDHDDLVIAFAFADAPDRTRRVRWVAASRVRIDLDFGEYAGHALVFSAGVRDLDARMWRVEIDFGGAPNGVIASACARVDLQ
jgi:hypothetical protein